MKVGLFLGGGAEKEGLFLLRLSGNVEVTAASSVGSMPDGAEQAARRGVPSLSATHAQAPSTTRQAVDLTPGVFFFFDDNCVETFPSASCGARAIRPSPPLDKDTSAFYPKHNDHPPPARTLSYTSAPPL